MEKRIAFVEWNTKVPVWNYEGTPSYACDTTNVIDATAFGACATAMEGSLVGIKPFLDTNNESELIKILNSFDVVALQTRRNWGEFLRVAKQLKTSVTLIVGFGMTGDQMRDEKKDMQAHIDLVLLMNTADIVTSFHSDMVPYLAAHTIRPVEHLPMCYPYNFVKSRFRAEEKDTPPRIVVPGPVWNNEPGGRRDDVSSIIVAMEIAKGTDAVVNILDRPMHRTDDYRGKAKIPADMWNEQQSRDEDQVQYNIFQSKDWPDFLEYISPCTMAIHCDWIYSTGRTPVEMAALGVLMLGGNSDHGKHLFPHLQSDEWDMTALIEDGRWLMAHPEARKNHIRTADDYGNMLDYTKWSMWFTSIVERYTT